MRVQRYALFPTPANLEGNFSPITTFLLSIPIRSLLQEGEPRADTQKQGPGPQDKNQDFLQRLSRRHPEALPSALKRKIGSSNISSDAWSWVSAKAHKKIKQLHHSIFWMSPKTEPQRQSVSASQRLNAKKHTPIFLPTLQRSSFSNNHSYFQYQYYNILYILYIIYINIIRKEKKRKSLSTFVFPLRR